MQKSLLTNIRKWLNRPFPFYETYKQKLVMPIILALLIMLVLIILNPSENTDVLPKQFFKVFAYGFITFFSTAFFNIILPEIFPQVFETEKWNVQKTLIFIFLSVVAIGITNAIFAFKFDNPNNNPHILPFLIAVLNKTAAIGFFPTIILVFYGERSLYKKNHLRALQIIKELNKEKQTKQRQTNTYSFAKNTKDEIKISENKLLYIKSEGNYCLLFYKKKTIILKHLIRSSLKEIEQILSNSDHFLRCHKSYIINLRKIYDVTGNAKGYIFHLNEPEYKIPASRNLSKSLIKNIKINKNKTD